MNRSVLRIAAVLPALGMLLPMVCGVFVPGYSSVGQQMSELEALGGMAKLITQVGAITSGVGIVAFAVVVFRSAAWRMPFTASMALVFGISMASNGVFLYGSPLHGLYGIGFCCVLIPGFFAAERPRVGDARHHDVVSLTAAVLILVYMWMMIVHFDPAALRGLTQRLACIPMFGWFAYAGMKLLDYDIGGSRIRPAGAVAQPPFAA